MAVERHLLTTDYDYLTDANGDYITVTAEANQPLVGLQTPLSTPRGSLYGFDAYILARSTGATVIARSTEQDVFAHGGRAALVTPRNSLYARRGSLIVDPNRPTVQGIYGTTNYGYSTYGSLLVSGQYGSATYGGSSYT